MTAKRPMLKHAEAVTAPNILISPMPMTTTTTFKAFDSKKHKEALWRTLKTGDASFAWPSG